MSMFSIKSLGGQNCSQITAERSWNKVKGVFQHLQWDQSWWDCHQGMNGHISWQIPVWTEMLSDYRWEWLELNYRASLGSTAGAEISRSVVQSVCGHDSSLKAKWSCSQVHTGMRLFLGLYPGPLFISLGTGYRRALSDSRDQSWTSYLNPKARKRHFCP